MNLYFSADDEKLVELDCVSSCGSLAICSSLHDLLALLCKILHFCAKWCRPIILFVLLCTTPNYTLLIVHKTVRLRNYRDYIWSIGGDAN